MSDSCNPMDSNSCDPTDCSPSSSFVHGILYWIELAIPFPWDLPNLGIEPITLVSPALAGRFLNTTPPGKPLDSVACMLLFLVAQLCLTFCDPMTAPLKASLSFTISWSLLKLTSIELVMPSNHLIRCHPLLLLPSTFLSIRLFSNESVLRIRWPKYWSFSFSISPSNEYSGLISYRMDWFDLAVQGTLKNLLQHHSSRAPIPWCSAFFTVQLSHPYMTTGKTIVLTRWTFFGKVMSLLFNMLSRLVTTFLPKSKRLLISWLHLVCC